MNLFVIVPVFIAIMFAIVILTILYQLMVGLGEWTRNNSLPSIAIPARIVSRRSEVNGRGGSQMRGRVWTTYFATFELKSGERLEFSIHGKEFGQLVEGDQGILTHQGTRYQGFARRGQGVIEE